MTSFFRTRLCAILVAAFVLFAAPVFAAGTPDPQSNPVLADITKTGAKLYYLGQGAGIDGWLIVKDGQIQIAYALPNSKYALIGGMFGPNGQNVSADQVQTLLTTNKELSQSLAGGAMASGQGVNPALSQDTIATAITSTAAPAAAAAPSTGALASPGERLLGDLQNAASVTLGDGSTPLMMVVNPNCPHCAATWKALRDAVMAKKLQIRMVPIGAAGTDDERAAAILLHVIDPLTAWDKYSGGDKSQLAGKPTDTMLAAVHTNTALVDSWHIQATPYFVYRNKDGVVKVMQGEPEQVTAVLNDLK